MQVFGQKPKYWINWNMNLTVAQVIGLCSLDTMAIPPVAVKKFKAKNINLLVQWYSSSGDHQRMYKISRQSIQQLLGYFRLDQSGGLAG